MSPVMLDMGDFKLHDDHSDKPENIQKMIQLMQVMIPLAMANIEDGLPCSNSDVIDRIVSIALTLGVSLIDNCFDADVQAPTLAEFQCRLVAGLDQARM